MAIDSKAIRRAIMVAKDIAASVSNVPLMRAKGGQIKTVQGPEREQNLAEFMRGAHPNMFDENGQPRIFYHGTGAGEKIRSLEPKHFTGMIFVSPESKFASNWAEERADNPSVFPIHVNTKNPWDYKNEKHVSNLINELKRRKIDVDSDWRAGIKKGDFDAIEGNPNVIDAIKKMGHDGVWLTEDDPYSPEGMWRNLGVFHPNQIKSAVGNRGTFDPTDPDITKASGGDVEGNGHPAQGYAPKPPATLKVDNPGGDWLQENREYSESRGYLPSGAPRSFGKVTATWRDPKSNDVAPVYLPVSMLSKIPGVMGEQNNVRPQDLDWLVDHMGKTGKLPKPKGNEYLPFITVDHRGIPFVSEGNHRIMAAQKLGWNWLPVEVRYFNGAEDVDGPLHPDRIKAMHAEHKAKGGSIDQDLKIANLIGADTSSIPEIRKAGELNKFRQSMQEDVQSRAQRMANLGQKYHESGLLPHPVGTLLQSPDSRQKNLPPMKVMGHYVDSKNPDRYGYFVNQGDSNGIALVSDPAADERIKKTNPSWDRQEYWNQTQPLRGPQGFAKAEGGEIDVKAPVIDPAKAIRRAKMVAKSIGGSNSESEQTEITPSRSETRTEAGRLQQPGGIRGGSGVLQTSLQADPAAPLTDFPADIAIPATGQIIKAGPNPLIRQVASEYMRSIGRPYRPATAYAKVSPPRATRIAKAYEEMKHDPQDPLVKASYNQMLKETMAQYEAAKAAGFKAEFWNPETDKDPYGPSPRLAIEDVNKNHHMFVFPTRAGFGSDEEMAAELHQNPLLADSGERWNGQPVTYNDIFRAVHDYYGHAKEGVGFRADGEENAWRSHAAMYSPLARLAMTSETRGQNSWVNYGPHGEHNRKARTEDTIFADQKNGILPAWVMHEGAEDFLHPDDVLETYKIYNRKHRADGGSLMDDDQPTTLKDPDLFDMSMLHETPKVAQFDLPRYMPARGVPERVADITKSRKVANKLADVIQSGLDMGGARWYNAEPLRKEFLKYHGQDVGNRMFRKYMDMVAATSPRSEVSQNVRNASYYYQRLASGQPVPEVGEKNPQPYGHLAQRLHQLNAQRVAGAGWDPLNNPKPASFAENLTGNQSPVTVDTHAFRLPSILAEDPRFIETAYKPSKEAPPQNIRKMVESGELLLKDALKTPAYWNAAPKETEYAAMEQMYKKAAQKLGITPAAAQAAAWVGGGKLTGLASDESKPFMQFVQDRIYKTAREKNMDPQDVLQKFVKGEMSLYSDGGAVDAALNIAKKARKE